MNNNFEQRVTGVKTDRNGNFIILNMEIQGKELSGVKPQTNQPTNL